MRGTSTGDIPGTDPGPDGTRAPAEWIARYIERHTTHQLSPSLDYVVVTHFHGDRMAGIDEVGRRVPMRKLIDRGYDYPEPLDSARAHLPALRRGASHAGRAVRAGAERPDRSHLRVAPGRASYEIFVVTDADESSAVLARHGPYFSR